MTPSLPPRMPAVPEPLGLGVGLDLPWGAPIGFERDPADPRGGDRVTPNVLRYLEANRDTFAYLFVSWQPKSRSRLRLDDYAPAYDQLFAAAPPFALRALHHTALNLGAMEPYDRAGLIAFTNALVARYGFAWVNEDLGLWSLRGRPLPYPLPPWLTDAGLEAAVANTREVQEALDVPLLVEFPGYSDGTSFSVGTWHAYDHFRELIHRTGSPCTLDVGHLLSYQWVRGRRGRALFDELERLPLAHCFEIHLSGCEVDGDRFLDYHHGVLMDEQLDLLDRLLERCPNLRAVTYEDPRFDAAGALVPRARPGFERLAARVARWAA